MLRMLNKEEQKHFKADPDALVAIVKFATDDLDMIKDIFPHGTYNDPRAKLNEDKEARFGN